MQLPLVFDESSALADLRQHIAQTCIITADSELLIDPKGNKHAWLLDLRPALLTADKVVIIAKLFWARMGAQWPFQLAAQELAGVPLLGAILSYGATLGFPATGVIVRKERKQYGRQRLVEGDLSELPIVIVDDIVNSGGSCMRAVKTLREAGARPLHIFTLMNFNPSRTSDQWEYESLKAHWLFELSDFGLELTSPPAAAATPAEPLVVKWAFEPPTLSYRYVARKAAPVVAYSHVYHATESGYLYALREADGQIAWQYRVSRHNPKGCWSTPLVTGEAVFIGSYDGAVFKLRRTDGELLWRFDGADWVGSSPCLDATGDLLFIGLEYAHENGSGAIACLSSATGEPLWIYPVPALVHASPLFIPPGEVICGANDGTLRSLDARSGKLNWETDVRGDIKSRASIGPRGERLYVGSCDGGIYAIDRRHGKIIWRYGTNGPVFSIPHVADGFLYATSTDGTAYKLEIDRGKLAAKRMLGGKLFSSPVPYGDELVLGSTTGKLTRLKRDNLALLSQHQFSERITAEVAISPRGLYVPTFDGKLFAFNFLED